MVSCYRQVSWWVLGLSYHIRCDSIMLFTLLPSSIRRSRYGYANFTRFYQLLLDMIAPALPAERNHLEVLKIHLFEMNYHRFAEFGKWIEMSQELLINDFYSLWWKKYCQLLLSSKNKHLHLHFIKKYIIIQNKGFIQIHRVSDSSRKSPYEINTRLRKTEAGAFLDKLHFPLFPYQK